MKTGNETGPDGLLLVDKPQGPTSHDVVASVRRLTGLRRIGHTGTLDPMASGLLPLVMGRATRLARFLPHSPKLYEGSFRLGLTTSTDDATGDLLEKHTGPMPAPELVLGAARGFLGRFLQVPPKVSARKVKGQRLYRLARIGRPVTAPPAEVEVFRFELQPTSHGAEWSFVAEVSSGTYIRAIVRDLGAALETGGVLTALRRVSIGPLHVARAVSSPTPDESGAGRLLSAVISPEAMPLVPPPLKLASAEAVRLFLSGSQVALPEGLDPQGVHRILDGREKLLGVGEVLERTVHPRVVLASPDQRDSLAPPLPH